ncbi:MAG: hotdog fold thioesterase [Bacteroidota bacterium]
MIPEHITPELVNQWNKNTMMEVLDMKFTEIGTEHLVATMPVDHRTHQPMGLLHGGATIALAETVGSVGSALMVDTKKFAVVGLNMQANHLKSIRSGLVSATGRIIHAGKSTHIWDITITGPEGQVISICRFTNFIKAINP